MTLLVKDLTPFCSQIDMTCTFYAGEVLNSEYAIQTPHYVHDSFDVTLFYNYQTELGEERLALIH